MYNAQNNIDVCTNIQELKRRIEVSALKAGRDHNQIKFVTVTKGIDENKIKEAIKIGLRDFGENRAQELCRKYNSSKELNYCRWHFIGHVQLNKVKQIVDKVDLIHSLDSIKLADEIQKNAEKIDRITQVLIQVNISGERSKFGFGQNDVMKSIEEISKMTNLRVKGLMTIAPNDCSKEQIRNVFKQLRKLYVDISNENINNIDMEFLSMGMSNDFEEAIEEGANLLRIGKAIFGPRV